MKHRSLTHEENVAIMKIFVMYNYSNMWPRELHHCIGEHMTTKLLRQRLLESTRIGGETMYYLSERGMAIARSLDPYVRPPQQKIHVGS